VSRKITGRYSGWMPGFMAAPFREGADYTGEFGARVAIVPPSNLCFPRRT
jgi:hypothetical protein